MTYVAMYVITTNWEYPLLAVAMVEAGFEYIGTYVTRGNNTVAHILRREQSWTSMSGILGGQGSGFLRGGGSRTGWTWRGEIRDQLYSLKESRRKARRRDWYRKRLQAGNEGG